MAWLRSGVCVLALATLTACGVSAPGIENVDSYTAEEIYERGEYEIAHGQPGRGAEFLLEIERLYPYSEWARRALIMAAYAYHKDGDYENSRSAAQRYIDIYPGSEDSAYAQYLLAQSYYDQIAEIGRDQGLTFQALQALRTLIETYPDSEYTSSAVLKFDLAFDHLAAKEMEVGRYYLARRQPAAAVRRFRVVVEDFQTTSHTAEALHRLVEAYLQLGLTNEAQTAGAVLGYNYQASEWYAASHKLLVGNGLSERALGDNWLSAIYRQMVRGEWR